MKNENIINKSQKIFYYRNLGAFFSKKSLYENYNIMKKFFNKDYNYMPETYYYPENRDLIESKFKNYKMNKDNLWLIKPLNKYGGRGIYIFKSLEQMKEKNFIITKYITNIDLINKKKYDLRIFVLISGLKPLRIYLYTDFLVRIASEDFSLNEETIGNKFIHLTNTDINKYHKNYKKPKSYNDENANEWNLQTYIKYLNKKNVNYKLIHKKIKDLIIKTIISLQAKLIEKNKNLGLNDINFFNIFGFDILINDNFNPILLEVNTNPSMIIYSIVENNIKMNIFKDTLNIIGIAPFSHSNNSNDGEFKFKNNFEEEINLALCELTRPRGGYELIFPLKENIKIYQKFFLKNIYENFKFWELIKTN